MSTKACLLSLFIPLAAWAAVSKHGAPISGKTALAVTTVLEKPAQYDGKIVLVEGQVRAACTRKGCWMELAASRDKRTQGCRVTFKDYGFFVPTDSAGATARVEGVVALRQVPADEVRHLESEGAVFQNKSPDGSAAEVRIVATGVELLR